MSISPPVPYDGRAAAPFGKAPRGARGAIRSPSPEKLSSNSETFALYPPRTRPSKSKGRYENNDNRTYAPVSPRDGSSGAVIQRMNTIKPGPFDVASTQSGRPSTSDSHMSDRRGETYRNASGSNENRGHMPQPSSNSGFSHVSSATSSPEKKTTGRMPKVERTGGYGGFGPPDARQDEQFQPSRPETKRSMTLPIGGTKNMNAKLRRPSDAGNGPNLREPSNISSGDYGDKNDGRVRPYPPGQGPRPLVSGANQTMPPPRRNSAGLKPKDLANLNLVAEFGSGNPYHTPSDSQSSDVSSRSALSKASSHSSPPGSNQTTNSPRKPSDTTALGGIMSDLQSKISNAVPRGVLDAIPQAQEQFAQPMPPRSLDPSLLSPESPMDPAIRGGRLSPISPRTPAESPTEKASHERLGAGNPTPQRRPSTTKGDCKGCGEPIKGKSVSSADGRLTGRYHKQCFVCKTCSEPFATSTFYVIDDAPYCERHYHKLNNSLCQTCDKGIEGQYLETERKQKYHPKCLTCSDCRRVLRDDYFEMNGLVYCERDAYRKAQQRNFLGPGTGTNKMERRTTRLMMMI